MVRIASSDGADPRHADHTDRSLGRADRLLPLLLLGSIAIGLAIGLITPSIAGALSGAVPLGVFGLIYVMMLSVGVDGAKHVLSEPRFVMIAVTLNFVVNPITAWLLGATMLADSPDLRIGLLLFLVTPCIGWFLVFTDLAGGDTSLGVGMLGINLALQIALLPVYLRVFVGGGAGVPLTALVHSVAVFLVAPAVAAGLTRRWLRSGRWDIDDRRLRASTGPIKATLLALVIIAMFAAQAEPALDSAPVLLRLLVPMALFFVAAFVIAVAVAHVAGLAPQQAALLAFTTTSRNSEASLAIAATAFVSPLVGLTVVLGPVIELPLLVAMLYVLNRRRDGLARRPDTVHVESDMPS